MPPHRTRRLLAPEVIQTSEMDCGPAALKCLLGGYGIPISYGRLREACQTDVDGTSIDVLARDVGIIGLFSDWPATTTFYANCLDPRKEED